MLSLDFQTFLFYFSKIFVCFPNIFYVNDVQYKNDIIHLKCFFLLFLYNIRCGKKFVTFFPLSGIKKT